jgi:uncharacterized membrane protein
MKNKRAPSTQAGADAIATSRSQIVIYWIVALVSLAGLADATYLTVQALTGETMVCGGSPDCFKVLGSPYARIGGVPLALVGAIAYFSVFSFAILAAFGYARVRRFLLFAVWSMFAVTLWLLYTQAFILHAFCRYCLFSAAMVFLLAGLIVASRSP